jgi:hypothetical protein
MWVKLGAEYLNLDHVFRVRVGRGFRNGNEECVAELEMVDAKGQIGVVTRIRGIDAQVLQDLLIDRCQNIAAEPVGTDTLAPGHALKGTVHDMKLP